MADTALKTLWLIHGVNLDMLGSRDPHHYGNLTLASLEEQVSAYAAGRGFSVQRFHTNHEGVLVEHLHLLSRGGVDALIINPGAWTHYSYAMHDALELIAAPVAEVHLSAVENREAWRRHSVIADLAAVRVSGEGLQGYFAAVDALAVLLASDAPTGGSPAAGDAPTVGTATGNAPAGNAPTVGTATGDAPTVGTATDDAPTVGTATADTPTNDTPTGNGSLPSGDEPASAGKQWNVDEKGQS